MAPIESEVRSVDSSLVGHGGKKCEHGGAAHANVSRQRDVHRHCGGRGADDESLFELGQRALTCGDPDAAAEHLQAELLREESIDAHLLLAEALWQKSRGRGDEAALPHYEAAAKLARAAADATKEGMIALGHGFALNQLGRPSAARARIEYARALAEADGNKQAAQFASSLLRQVGESTPMTEDSELMRTMWKQFAEAVSATMPAFLFLRGTLARPSDEASSKGVARLRAAGCRHIESLDVDQPGDHVPEGLQGVSKSPHLEFPQLFVEGKELLGWLELTPDELRQRLERAGMELGEVPASEPCHGATAFSDGLEPWEVALVEVVSKEGSGDWDGKAKMLEEHLPDIMAAETESYSNDIPDSNLATGAAALEAAWERLAPLVREKLDKQPEMPCGHSCATCPTRHDCQLHDAVDGGGLRDMEDLG
jgi:glutaredoxin-related protein